MSRKKKAPDAPAADVAKEVSEMVLFAWVGEDQLGKEGFGIKQAICPSGFIPMVSCKAGKLDQEYIVEQMEALAKRYGKPITLARFKFDGVLAELKP